jgi:hypothetical protein
MISTITSSRIIRSISFASIGLGMLLSSCSADPEALENEPVSSTITLIVDTENIHPDSVAKHVRFARDTTVSPKIYTDTVHHGDIIEWVGVAKNPVQGEYIEITLIKKIGGKSVLRGGNDHRPSRGSGRTVRAQARTNTFFYRDRTEDYSIEFRIFKNNKLSDPYVLDPKLRLLRKKD